MLRPKAKPPVTRVSAAREAEEAEPDLSPERAEIAFARSAEAEHRGKRPPKEGVTTNNDTGWYSNNNNINYAIATATTASATYNF